MAGPMSPEGLYHVLKALGGTAGETGTQSLGTQRTSMKRIPTRARLMPPKGFAGRAEHQQEWF
jgi:hypothetical protein